MTPAILDAPSHYTSEQASAWPAVRCIQPLPSLAVVMIELAKHGKPWVFLATKGWASHCDMKTNAVGSSFTIRATSGHATPLAAATQCLERVQAAMKDTKP